MKQLVSPTNISISNMNANYKYFCALWEFTVGRENLAGEELEVLAFSYIA